MLDSLTKKQKIIFILILGIMIAVIIYYIYSTVYKEDFILSYNNDAFIDNTEVNTIEMTTSESNTNTIIVYVCGAVKENKVVKLPENSRICDAIDAVDGLTNDADLTNINLAYILEDGEKIYIPKKGETLESPSINSSSSQITSNISSKNKKININKASQTELESIPGIGPSTASKIIDYRETNRKIF